MEWYSGVRRLSIPLVVRACTRLGVLAISMTMARAASRARMATIRPRTRIGTVRPAMLMIFRPSMGKSVVPRLRL